MARTDIHRPSVINPEDYEFVGLENVKIEHLGDCYVALDERARIKAHMERTGGRYSNHEHGGTCSVCGAAAVWTILFHHAPTNTYIRTGQDCADKLEFAYDSGGMDRFKKSAATALKNQAGKQKARLMLAAHGLGKAFDLFEETKAALKSRTDFAQARRLENQTDDEYDTVPWWKLKGCPPEPSKDRMTLDDMVSKMVAWGDDWTEKQVAFARVLVDRIERETAIAAERAAAAPVPVTDKRIRIEGTVLSTKTVCGEFGYTTKALVRTVDGWKAWGTTPLAGLKHGDRVAFMARIEASKDDPKYGFFKRPTQGEVLA